jgi:hypothetical protein
VKITKRSLKSPGTAEEALRNCRGGPQELWKQCGASGPRAAAKSPATGEIQNGFLLLFPFAPAVRSNVTCKATKSQQQSVLVFLFFPLFPVFLLFRSESVFPCFRSVSSFFVSPSPLFQVASGMGVVGGGRCVDGLHSCWWRRRMTLLLLSSARLASLWRREQLLSREAERRKRKQGAKPCLSFFVRAWGRRLVCFAESERVMFFIAGEVSRERGEMEGNREG